MNFSTYHRDIPIVGSQVNSSAAGSKLIYDARRFCSAIVSMSAVQNVV